MPLIKKRPTSNLQNHQQWLIFVAVVLSSSLLYFFGTGLTSYFLLTWLAPLPILWFVLHTESKRPLLAGFLAYFLGSLNMFGYLSIHVPYAVILLTLLGQALAFAFGLWLFSRGVRRNKLFGALLLACFWVCFEWLLSTLSPHGTFGSLAYSQLDFTLFTQLAYITGIWGMVFCLLFIPAVFVLALQQGLRYWLFLIVISASLLIPAWIRVNHNPTQHQTLKIGMIAADSLLSEFNATDINVVQNTLNQYLQMADKLVNQGSQILLLPEKIITVNDDHKAEIKHKLEDYAAHKNVLLVIGLTSMSKEGKENLAWVFDEGQFIGQYSKQHLVPGWESGYKKGQETLMFSKWGIQMGIAICKDMDFPKLTQFYSENNVDLMMVPAWDFGADAQLHNNMSRMRAVEGGFAIVRAASEGLLTLTNALGETVYVHSSGTQAIVGVRQILNIRSLTNHQKWFGLWVGSGILLSLLVFWLVGRLNPNSYKEDRLETSVYKKT